MGLSLSLSACTSNIARGRASQRVSPDDYRGLDGGNYVDNTDAGINTCAANSLQHLNEVEGGVKLVDEKTMTELALQAIEAYIVFEDTTGTTHVCVGCGFAAEGVFGSYTADNRSNREVKHGMILDLNAALDYLLVQSKAGAIDTVDYGRIFELFSTLIRLIIENEAEEADKILQIALATIKELELAPSQTATESGQKYESKPSPWHIATADFKLIESILADELKKFYPNINAALLLLDCTESILSRNSQHTNIVPTSISLQSLTSLLHGMMLRKFLSVHPERHEGFGMACLLAAIGSRIAGEWRPRENPLQNVDAFYPTSLDIMDCRNLVSLCKAVPRQVACGNLSKILAGALYWNTNTRYNFNEAGICILLASLQKDCMENPVLILKINDAIKLIITGSRCYKQEFIQLGVVGECNRGTLHYLELEGTALDQVAYRDNDTLLLEVIESFSWVVHLLSSASIQINPSVPFSMDYACTIQFNSDFSSREGIRAIRKLIRTKTTHVPNKNKRSLCHTATLNTKQGTTSVPKEPEKETRSAKAIANTICELVCYSVHNVAVNNHIDSSFAMYVPSTDCDLASLLCGLIASRSENSDVDYAEDVSSRDAAVDAVAKIVASISTHIDRSNSFFFWNKTSKELLDVCESFRDRITNLGILDAVICHSERAKELVRSGKCKAKTAENSQHVRAAQIVFLLYYTRLSTECVRTLNDIGAIYSASKHPRITEYLVDIVETHDSMAATWSFEFVRREDRWARRKKMLLPLKRRLMVDGGTNSHAFCQLFRNFYLVKFISAFI